MTGLRGRARVMLALGAAVTLVATGALTWVAISDDDEWHGGEPGVVLTPATPGESTGNTPSPLPTGPEPVFPTPQQSRDGTPTGTPGASDPGPTDYGRGPGAAITPAKPGGGAANTPSPLPTAPAPVFPLPQQTRDLAPTGTPGTGEPSPTGTGGGQQQGTDAPASGSPGGGVRSGQPDSGLGR